MKDGPLRIRRYKLSNVGEWLKVIWMADSHIGHRAFQEKRMDETIEWIKSKSPKNCRVLFGGDGIENVHKITKGDIHSLVVADPEEQCDILEEKLEPIKQYIDMMLDGNHEYRSTRVTGARPLRRVAKNLGIPYLGYRGMIEYSLQGKSKGASQKYYVYLEHGSGSLPKTIAGRYGKLSKMGRFVDADVYLGAHIHHKLVFPEYKWRIINHRPIKMKTLHVSCGSFLEDAEYATRSGFEPTIPGVSKIQLSTTKHDIHCNI